MERPGACERAASSSCSVKFLVVGEQRSELARKRNVRWEDEALAARPLFAALRACGIDPLAECRFVNLFESGGIARVHEAQYWGITIIGLGSKVHVGLLARGVEHIHLIHPAARGAIRKRERYIAHVSAMLKGA